MAATGMPRAGTEQLCARCTTGWQSAAVPLRVPAGIGVPWGFGEGAAAPQAVRVGLGRCMVMAVGVPQEQARR